MRKVEAIQPRTIPESLHVAMQAGNSQAWKRRDSSFTVRSRSFQKTVPIQSLSVCPDASFAPCCLAMRQICLILLAIFSLLNAGCGDSHVGRGYEPQVGDVIFQSFPHSPLTDAIETVSRSSYSHCGMIVRTAFGFRVLEAIGPVTTTSLDDWIQRGRNHGFAVYRLRPAYSKQLTAFVDAAKGFVGRPYDIHFGFDDATIYCSELVFTAFKQATGENLGIVRKLGDLNWKPEEAFIRKIENGGLPLDREMITPKELAAATQLELVIQRGFP